MTTPIDIAGLMPQEYEHPFDAKALNALNDTPGLETAVRQFNKYAVERFLTIEQTGSGIRVTPDHLGEIHSLLVRVCRTVHLPKIPDLYLRWGYDVNGFTVGVENPLIVLHSGAVDLLSEDELLYLIGHEVGHIKSRHTLYHQMALAIPILGEILGKATLGIGEVLSLPLQYALLAWQRMSEFTADRAGLLACQNSDAAFRVMTKFSGMPMKYYDRINPEAFIEQARQFKCLDYDTINKGIKFFSTLDESHPWSVIRAAELLAWQESGAYDAVVHRATAGGQDTKLVRDFVFCSECGYRMDGGESYCPSCGKKV
jgi:Zn-dependent protease with chaperone function